MTDEELARRLRSAHGSFPGTREGAWLEAARCARDLDQERSRRLVDAAKNIDRFLDGWCPTTCSCAKGAEPLHEELRAALAEYKGLTDVNNSTQ